MWTPYFVLISDKIKSEESKFGQFKHRWANVLIKIYFSTDTMLK